MKNLTILYRFAAAFLFIQILSLAAFSQIETNSVPARWEYYSGKDKKVSFLMPRQPVALPKNNHCYGEDTEVYAAYTDGVVYRVDITTKIEPSPGCYQKRNFDADNFKRRVAALRAELKEETNSENNISGKITIKFVGAGRIAKIVNDYENRRWFEMNVYGADETKPEVNNFFASLKKDNYAGAAIAIGQGAAQTFGDEVSKDNGTVRTMENLFKTRAGTFEETFTEIDVSIKDASEKPMTVVLKPLAGYTEAARRAGVQGRVVLNVSFMANGAVGKIFPMQGLSNGLTEEAIKAARKIVFVPPQKDGVRYTTVKTVEYGFSIY